MNTYPGIYKIEVGDYFYYGQTQNLHERKLRHLSNLRSQRYKNPIMQNVFNKYGDFKFEIIFNCPVEDLDEAEQDFLDKFVGMEKCMNIATDATYPGRGLTLSSSHKERIKTSQTGSTNSNFKEQTYTFKHKTGSIEIMTPYELSKIYQLDRSHLTKMIKGTLKSHKGWRIN